MWKTSITKIEPDHIVTRGYRQEDLIGNEKFCSVFFLLITGRLPSDAESKMTDALITASIDHGITPPSTHASRVVASAGVPLPTAVAAGILAVGDIHGGAIEESAHILQDTVKKMRKNNQSIEHAAVQLYKDLKSSDRRMPGLGHRIHKNDPRTERLFKLADELKITADHINLFKTLKVHFDTEKKLPINVDGAIAAIISDMGFDWRLGKGFFLLGRTAGLIAHVYEEIITQKPMRPICQQEVEYDGPWERLLEPGTKK